MNQADKDAEDADRVFSWTAAGVVLLVLLLAVWAWAAAVIDRCRFDVMDG